MSMVESDSSMKSMILSRALVGPARRRISSECPILSEKSFSKMVAKFWSIETSVPWMKNSRFVEKLARVQFAVSTIQLASIMEYFACIKANCFSPLRCSGILFSLKNISVSLLILVFQNGNFSNITRTSTPLLCARTRDSRRLGSVSV